MALVNSFILGRLRRLTGAVESSFNDPVLPTSAQSFKITSGEITYDENRKMRQDTRQHRDMIEAILGTREGSFSLSTYVLPNGGGAGTEPDCGFLLQCAFGTVSGVGTGPVVYSLAEAPSSFSIWEEDNAIYGQGISGGVVDDWSLSIPGGDEPTMSFGGMMARRSVAGTATVSGTLSSGTDLIPLATTAPQSEPGIQFEPGAFVAIGTLSGFEVTAVTTTSLTVTPTLSAGIPDGSAVIPWTPWSEGSTGGNVVTAIDGQVNLTGIDTDNDLVIVAAEVAIKNNWKAIYGAFQQVSQDYTPGWREVTGKLTFFGRTSDIYRFMRGQQNPNEASNQQALRIILGDSTTSGSDYVQVDCPRVGLDFSSVSIPEAEEATIEVPFRAYSSSGTTSDSITLTFDTA